MGSGVGEGARYEATDRRDPPTHRSIDTAWRHVQLEAGGAGAGAAVEGDPEDPGFSLGGTVDELRMQQVGWWMCVFG